MTIVLDSAEIELAEEEFNSMPGRNKIIEDLDSLIGAENYKVVDASKTHWQNEEDTLVIAIPKNLEVGVGLRVAEFVLQNNIDEYNTVLAGENHLIRFWWD